jgi:hypothetical protein
MTSFMIGDAVRRHPDVAAEIVRRGHEAGAHGRSWQRQYQLPKLLRTGVPTAADLGQVPAAGVPCGVPSSRSSDCRPRCHSALNDYRLLGLGEITGRHLDEG